MGKADYVEWVPIGRFIKATILVLVFFIISVMILVLVFVQPFVFETFIVYVIPFGILVFFLFLLGNFRGIKIRIDTERLLLKYGLFNSKSILLSEIDSCRVVKASFKRFGGVGVRYGFDRSYAYTTSFGNAVEITPKKGRSFVFSSNYPAKICSFITKDMKNIV